jgi:glycosyltransferase involved in cell wall biosynthesis
VSRPVGYLLDRYLQTSQTFVSNEIDEMRAQGVEVVVVALRRGDRDLDDDPRVLYLEDIALGRRLLLEHLRWLVRHPIRYARFAARVIQLRKDMGTYGELLAWQRLPRAAAHLESYDAVELHAHFAWWGATAAACLAPLLGVPWSVTLHAKDIFSKQRCLPQKLRMADVLITVCDYNLRWMREHLGLTRDVGLVICGVHLPAPDEQRITGADVVVVGRLIEKKGVDVLIAATAELRVLLPDVRVHVIGEGPLREQLEAQAAALGLGDAVQFLGRRAHDEVLQRIGGARVFCLPARIAEDGDRDSMPVVIKEAMVRRVPVVGSDVAAVPEMLDEGCGILVPPDDPAALAEVLHRLLVDEALRAVTTELAWQRASEHFTLTGEVHHLKELILHDT